LHIVDSLGPSDVLEQVQLLAGLACDGYELHVCALRNGVQAAALRSAGVDVHVLPRRLAFDPWTLVRLKQHIAALRPDLVQTWLFEANLHGRLAASSAGVHRLVAVERRLDTWKRWPQWQVDRRLAPRTSRIVTAATLVRDYYAAHGVRPRDYTVIPDGVPPPIGSSPTRAELLEELKLPADACLIGVCAPLRTDSRLKDLIWGLDVLKWVHERAHLLIIGDGPQRRQIMRYVDCVEVADCVHFLGPRGNTTLLISCLDFLWHAASRDGAALAVRQALWCGVPVIALDTPVHRELIKHGETGFLAEPNDRPSLARWTHNMLEDSSLRERVAQAGQRRAREEFSSEKLLADYRRLYSELLA
jgi:glycosyltransferase involved in cell wall biosynthesis